MADAVPAFLRSWGPMVAMWVVIVSLWAVMWWMTRRDRRRAELQQQLREMEQAIYEETLPEDEREALRRVREQRAEIRREARRRLGLPERKSPSAGNGLPIVNGQNRSFFPRFNKRRFSLRTQALR